MPGQRTSAHPIRGDAMVSMTRRWLTTLAAATFASGLAAAPLSAQSVIDPKNVSFTASSDHSTLDSGGSPVLDHYELDFYQVGASQPFQSTDLGKPTPDGTGKITVSFFPLLASVPT